MYNIIEKSDEPFKRASATLSFGLNIMALENSKAVRLVRTSLVNYRALGPRPGKVWSVSPGGELAT